MESSWNFEFYYLPTLDKTGASHDVGGKKKKEKKRKGDFGFGFLFNC